MSKIQAYRKFDQSILSAKLYTIAITNPQILHVYTADKEKMTSGWKIATHALIINMQTGQKNWIRSQ